MLMELPALLENLLTMR